MHKAIYLILTSERVRAYSTYACAIKVYQRARRMGVKDIEFVRCDAKAGDPYKRAKIVDSMGGAPSCFRRLT